MRKQLVLLLAATSSVCLSLLPQPSLGDEIPKSGWRRPLGQPLKVILIALAECGLPATPAEPRACS